MRRGMIINMDKKKEVSVVIPAYNREKTIRRCVDSVLSQTYPVREIIVVDDGSQDNTIRILEEEYKDSVLVIKQSHKGAQAARNAGIIAARSEYIAFLDSDDEWLDKKIELQMRLLDKKPDAVVCGNGYVEQNGVKRMFRLQGCNGNVYKSALSDSFALFPTIVSKKENLVKIGLLDERVPSFQEWDTSIMLSKTCEFLFVERPLFIYHLHDGETISKNTKRDIDGQEYILNKYKYEILSQYGMKGIIKRYESIMQRCKRLKDKRYYKYLLLFILSKKGVFLARTGERE